MNSTSIACREAGATIILAVQASVRDESLLFGLLPGLSMAQRNLLTYMFERHTGFRKGPQEKASDAVDLSVNSPGKELLSREMRRLSLKM
jgi:CLIP-associating protein 1/2